MDKEKKVLLGIFSALALAAIIFAGWMIMQTIQDENKERYVMVDITMQDGGVIRLELDREAAPRTVDNFVKLVEKGYYDGLTFHRVIPGFMIQGGDPSGDGTGGPGYTIKGEFSANGWDNPIKHTRGVISMARSNGYDTGGSQFFIVHEDYPSLDGNYAAFGRVLSGMDVVDRIVAVEADDSDKPLEPVVIASIRVVGMSNQAASTEADTASAVSGASGIGTSGTTESGVSGTAESAASGLESTPSTQSSSGTESGAASASGSQVQSE